MRIALLTYSTKPRGSVLHTLELANALHKLGHFICVYALDKDGQGFDFPLSCDVQLVRAQSTPPEIDALIQQRINEFVAHLSKSNLDYDCYHAQDCISANALAILAEQQKIPHFVRTVHHIEDYNSLYLRQCQDRSIRAAKLCFCVSDRWQEELQKQYQIQALRVLNGVNLDRFSAVSNGCESALKERLSLRGLPIYLTVGGIEPRKNSIRLLKAFAQVRSRSAPGTVSHFPSAQLVIAGGATLFDYQAYRDEFFALAEQLNIGQSLVLPGVISDAELPMLYRCADAFVFPSVKEGWGLVVMEAIASGLPVITANQAPFTEFLSETQALLVDPNSESAIAQAMQEVVKPERSRYLIEQSRSILSCYTWEASAKRHLQYYQQLIDQSFISFTHA